MLSTRPDSALDFLNLVVDLSRFTRNILHFKCKELLQSNVILQKYWLVGKVAHFAWNANYKSWKILPTPEISIMSACMCIIVPSTHILAISPSHCNAVNLKENMEVNFRVVVLLFWVQKSCVWLVVAEALSSSFDDSLEMGACPHQFLKVRTEITHRGLILA